MPEKIIEINIKATKADLDKLSPPALVDLLIELRIQIEQLSNYVEARLEE